MATKVRCFLKRQFVSSVIIPTKLRCSHFVVQESIDRVLVIDSPLPSTYRSRIPSLMELQRRVSKLGGVHVRHPQLSNVLFDMHHDLQNRVEQRQEMVKKHVNCKQNQKPMLFDGYLLYFNCQGSPDEEFGGEGHVYKLKRRVKEEQELDERARKVIEAITDDDIPILRLYPNAPNVPKDVLETKGDEWLHNPDLWKKAELHFEELGDERPSTKFLREFYAKRLAKIEYFCKEVVPKQYGHLYCTHTKAQHKKMKEDFIKSRISLLPYPPPLVVEMKVNRFIPPERELGEDDSTYQTRWVEARIKYNSKVTQEYNNRPTDTLYYGQSYVKVKIIDAKENKNEEERQQTTTEGETDELLTENSVH